jgi:hypothetical protein
MGAVVAVAVGGTGVEVGGMGVAVGGADVAVGGTGVAVDPGGGVLVGALVAVGGCGVVPATVDDGDPVVALAEALAEGLAEGLAVGEPALGEATVDPPGLAAVEGAGEAVLADLPESSPPRSSAHQPRRAATTAATTPSPRSCFHAVGRHPRPSGPGPPSPGGRGDAGVPVGGGGVGCAGEESSGGTDVIGLPRPKSYPKLREWFYRSECHSVQRAIPGILMPGRLAVSAGMV